MRGRQQRLPSNHWGGWARRVAQGESSGNAFGYMEVSLPVEGEAAGGAWAGRLVMLEAASWVADLSASQIGRILTLVRAAVHRSNFPQRVSETVQRE
jgi:hypothetical protein